MTAVQLDDTDAAVSIAPDGFAVRYVTADGIEHRALLAEAWATIFESGMPVRGFTARKGQEHLSGLWWSATLGRQVGFESWLERDHAMPLDFHPSVVGIASQPFWLDWHEDTSGRPVSHVPDFFVRRRDGSAVVIDCRPIERRPPRDAAKFEATARAGALVRWEYRLVEATDAIETSNVRWLARLPAPAPSPARRRPHAS